MTRFAILAALAVVAGGVAARAHAQGQAGGPPPSVTVAEARVERVIAAEEYVGRTVAVEDAVLRARVDGYLVARLFEEGDDVVAGDPLFRIEQAPYEAAVAAAAADLARAEAEKIRAERDLVRVERLNANGNASDAQLDEARAAARSTSAQVNAAAAALRLAELDLGFTEVKAPFDGRIGEAFVDIGNLVGPNAGDLANLAKIDPIHVTFSMSEGDYLDFASSGVVFTGENANIRPQIRLPNGRLYERAGRIDFVNNRVNASTGDITVRASFDNPAKTLLPGLFVTVIAERGEPFDAVLVPQVAVQEDQQGYFVLMVNEEDTVEIRRVALSDLRGPDWIVEQGLRAGDRVIIEGLQKVRPGQTVSAEKPLYRPDTAGGGR